MCFSVLEPSFSTILSSKWLYESKDVSLGQKVSFVFLSFYASVKRIALVLKSGPTHKDGCNWSFQGFRVNKVSIQPICKLLSRENKGVGVEGTELLLSEKSSKRVFDILNFATYCLQAIACPHHWHFKAVVVPTVAIDSQELTVEEEVSNASIRMRQFSMQTANGSVAQKYWNISSKHILNVIAELSMSGSIENLFAPSVFSYIEFKHEKKKYIAHPFLFVCLGLVRNLLEECLKIQRKNLSGDDFKIREFIDQYFSLTGKVCESMGHFRSDQDGAVVEVLVKNGRVGFSSEFNKLIAAQGDLLACLAKYPYQYELDATNSLTEKKRTILSSLELSEFDLKEMNKLASNHFCDFPFFVNCESNGDKYAILKTSYIYTSYTKIFLPKNGSDRFVLGQNLIYDKKLECMHMAEVSKMWPFLQNKFEVVVAAVRNKASVEECLQKIGEFVFLYINVMPYQRGSAAIGEWLMRGLARACGLELGAFKGGEEALSWDFSAFIEISAEEYGKKFKTFFKEITAVV